MRKCISVKLLFDNEDFTELSRQSGLSIEDIRAFVDAKYKPTEPLIKDEKIRKAIRAWIDANDYEKEDIYQFFNYETFWKSWSLEHQGNGDDNGIHFNGGIDLGRADDGSFYTITELCGEEEG